MVVETGEIPEIKNGRANAFDFATEDGFWSSEMITLIQMRHLPGQN